MKMDDWRDYEGADDWVDQWRKQGYAELPHRDASDEYHDVVVFISEMRWRPPQYEGWLPSRLWDEATPSQAYQEMTPREKRWWKKALSV